MLKHAARKPSKVTSPNTEATADHNIAVQDTHWMADDVPRHESVGSDNVFIQGESKLASSFVIRSTQSRKGSVQEKVATESLSSSFDSEALDIVASLKSSHALKAQYQKYAKFPVDVNITPSPTTARRSDGDKGYTPPSAQSLTGQSSASSVASSSPAATTQVCRYFFWFGDPVTYCLIGR